MFPNFADAMTHRHTIPNDIERCPVSASSGMAVSGVVSLESGHSDHQGCTRKVNISSRGTLSFSYIFPGDFRSIASATPSIKAFITKAIKINNPLQPPQLSGYNFPII